MGGNVQDRAPYLILVVLFSFLFFTSCSMPPDPPQKPADPAPPTQPQASSRPEILLSAENGRSLVSTFAIDESTGVTVPVGQPVKVDPGFPRFVVADPKGDFVYVVTGTENDGRENDFGANEIVGFRLGPDGALTQLPAVLKLPVGWVPAQPVIGPSGKFLYIGSNGLVTYSINRQDGSLKQPFSPKLGPPDMGVFWIEIAGGGKYLVDAACTGVVRF
jgi:hypothetical protein